MSFDDLAVLVVLIGIAIGFLASWLQAREEWKRWEGVGEGGPP